MKSYRVTFFALVTVVLLLTSHAARHPEARERTKRSFRSYFNNYFDEMATSACVAIGNNGGLYFAVRRNCGSAATCTEICTSESVRREAHIWDPKKLLNSKCEESFHVYKRRPSLADNKDEDTDLNKVGMTIYRYTSCNKTGCGPNYCCCSGLP